MKGLVHQSGGLVITGQTEVTAVYGETIAKGDAVFIKNIYSQETLTKLADPATGLIGQVNALVISKDRNYMALTHGGTNYITINKRNGDLFQNLTAPAIAPAGTGSGADFSNDGTYLAIGHIDAPFITIYKRSGDVFTKLANPATLPVESDTYSASRSVSFSTDGVYMAIAHSYTYYFIVYKRSGDVFTKLAEPAIMPTGVENGVRFSPDGTYLAYAHKTTPFITIYKRSGDVFTKLANPASLGNDTGTGVVFSADGVYLAVTHGGATYISPYLIVYKRSGDVFTKLANPAIMPPGAGLCADFSNDGTYLAIGHGTAPWLTMYKRGLLGARVFKSNLLSALTDYAELNGIGYAKEAGVLNDSKTIVKLWG